MGRIHEKLKSERGASILLALLLMLICMMVGASVLMAAASNAGRTRSNRDSHQAYLALSSALWMVIDDLTSQPYYGRYSYVETHDPDDHVTSKIYKQEDGSYACQLGSVLRDDMDSLFVEVMNRQSASDTTGAIYETKSSTGLSTEHILTVSPDDEHFDDFTVRIMMTVGQQNDKGILTLQASLEDTEEYGDYLIQAELTAALPAWKGPSNENKDSEKSECYRSGAMQWADPKITRELTEEAGS